MQNYSFLTLLLLMAACSGVGGPAAVDDNVEIALMAAPEARRFENGLAVDIHLELTNTGRTAVTYTPCSAVLEREINGTWDVVWTAVCIPEATPQLLNPGVRDTATIPISMDFRRPISSPVDVDGDRFRLKLSVFSTRNTTLVTEPFQLTN